MSGSFLHCLYLWLHVLFWNPIRFLLLGLKASRCLLSKLFSEEISCCSKYAAAQETWAARSFHNCILAFYAYVCTILRSSLLIVSFSLIVHVTYTLWARNTFTFSLQKTYRHSICEGVFFPMEYFFWLLFKHTSVILKYFLFCHYILYKNSISFKVQYNYKIILMYKLMSYWISIMVYRIYLELRNLKQWCNLKSQVLE